MPQQSKLRLNDITIFPAQQPLHSAIAAAHHALEADCIRQLLDAYVMPEATQQQIDALAWQLSTATAAYSAYYNSFLYPRKKALL